MVKPNVDTVYSRVIIDLSQNDLVLTVPSITDRFYIFPFYDVFVLTPMPESMFTILTFT